MAADGILIGLSVLAGVVLGPLSLVLLPIGVLLLQFLRRQLMWPHIALVLACSLIGVWRGSTIDEPLQIRDLAASTGAVGVIHALPVAGGASERTVLSIEQIQSSDGAWHDASGKVMLYLRESQSVSLGDRVSVVWSASAIESAPPGYASFLSAHHASGSAHARSVRIIERGPNWLRNMADIRRAIARNLRQALPGDAGVLAAGIVTGDDAGMSEVAESAFRRTGTAHITAVSGQNVGLLLAFCALWMRPTRRSTRIASHVAMIAIVWLYALMVGMEAPALRAAVVATLTILGTYSGRRPDPLTLLALTLGGMVLVEPRMAQGVGFWLSASASYALCSAIWVEGESSFGTFIRQAAKGVVAANVATLPILIHTFGEWSPVSPLANLLIGPLLTVTFPAAYLLALVLLIWPQAAPFLAWLPGIGLDTTIVIVQRIGDVLPVVNMDTPTRIGALLVGGPCFASLLLLSRDGDRWVKIVMKRWHDDRIAVLTMACGSAVGLGVAVVLSVLIWA